MLTASMVGPAGRLFILNQNELAVANLGEAPIGFQSIFSESG
jgi:hypothetical protein